MRCEISWLPFPGQGHAFEPHGPIAGHRLGARHGATTLGATAARGWDRLLVKYRWIS